MSKELELWLVVIVVAVSVSYLLGGEPGEGPPDRPVLTIAEKPPQPQASVTKTPPPAGELQAVTDDAILWLHDPSLNDPGSDPALIYVGGQRETYLHPGQEVQFSWPRMDLWDDHVRIQTLAS